MSDKESKKRKGGHPLDHAFSPPAKNIDQGLKAGVNQKNDSDIATLSQKENSKPVEDMTEQELKNSQKSPFEVLSEVINKNKGEPDENNSGIDMEKFSEAYYNLIENLLETPGSKLYKLTDLEKGKIPDLSTLDTIANYYDFKAPKEFLNSLFTLLISKDRKGRSEMLQIGQMLNQLHSMNMMTNSPMMQMMSPYMMSGMMSNQMGQMGMNVPVAPVKKKRFGIF